MNQKKATYVLLAILFGVAVIYVKSAFSLNQESASGDNQAVYPIILGGLLVIFIIVDFLQSLKAQNQSIKMNNVLFMVGTLVIVMVYFYLWSTIGYFYILTFIVLLILLTLYKNQFKVWKTWLLNGVISVTVTLSIYYIFGMLLNITFS